MDNMFNFYITGAIHKKDIDCINSILNAYPDTNVNQICQDREIPLLFLAIESLCPEICEILCKKGANLGPFKGLNITPLGYLLSKNNAGYQNLDYIKLRIILLLLRYGANPDFIESGMLSSRDMLDILGYTIKNNYLVTKVSVIQKMEMENYDIDTIMIIDDINHNTIEDDSIDECVINSMTDTSMSDNVIEFKDNIDPMITID